MNEDDEKILLAMEWDEFDFIIHFDPDRERSANRRELVEVLEYIQTVLIEARQMAS